MRAPLLLCLVVAIGCHQTDDQTDELVLTCKGDEPAPPPPTPGACLDGWCWANPLPQGLALTTVWASGPDTAWIVGANGTLLHAQGDALELMASGTQGALTDVWGSSDQDVWAAGKGGTLLHWDGTRWQAIPSTTTQDLSSLTGHSANDVWAAGASGTLLHWNGVAWEQVALPSSASVRDISSAGPDTVWATTGGDLLRCTPASCETVSADVRVGDQPFSIKELLSFSPDEVFALSTALLRWKDGAWSSLWTSDIMKLSTVSHLAGSGPEDLWVSFYYPGRSNNLPVVQELRHFGTASAGPAAPAELVGPYTQPLPIYGLAAASPGHLHVVTWHSQVFRLADGQWRSLVVTPPFRIAPDFSAPRALGREEIVTDVAALPTGEVGVAAVGVTPSYARSRLFSDSAGNTWVAKAWRGKHWLRGTLYVPTQDLFLEVQRVGADGTQQVVHRSNKPFDGSPPADSDYAPAVVGIHGSSERNVWVVSASDVLHWNGATWTSVMQLASEEKTKFTGAVWTTSSKAAWIGLTDGLLAWDGEQLKRVDKLPGFWARGLWASSSHDVWAVGASISGPIAYHFDGNGWSQMELPVIAENYWSIADVVGRCESDVYLVGDSSRVLHWDGAQWTIVPMPLGIKLIRGAKVGSELWVLAGSMEQGMEGSNALARHAW